MKSILKSIALLAVALPMAVLTSCSDDEENNKGGEEIIEIRPIDGVEFVKNCWVLFDENGKFVCLSQGRILNEAEPTVAYVGVTDLAEAKENFLGRLVPRDAKYVENGNNITVTLTDTLGKELNKVFFTAVGDGETFATVKLEKSVGIEKYVSEFRYIDKKFWPENSMEDCPFEEGCIYTYKNVNYVCIKVPEAGQNGILFTDLDEREFFPSGTVMQSVIKEFIPQFPSRSVFQAVDAKLLGEEGDKYLKLLNACIPYKGSIKDHTYWTSTYEDYSMILYNLTTHSSRRYSQATDRYTSIYKAEACDIVENGSEVIVLKVDPKSDRYSSKLTIPADDWSHNEELERQALSK